jgi:peptide/nickel transport system substrate-binding protein
MATWPVHVSRGGLALAAAGVLGIAALTGCGAGSGSTTATSAVNPSQAVLRIALAPGSELNWWPPLQSATNCGDLVGGGGANGPNIYIPMLNISSQDTIDYPLSIASGITVSNNDTTYTVQLRSNWTWSNGTPVTSADVVYDWDLIKAAAQPSSPIPYCFTGEGNVPQVMASVTAAGPHTVVFTATSSVNPLWFEENALSQIVPLPKAVWDKYSNLDQELQWMNSISNAPTNPVYQVVDGPYRLASVKTDQYWKFVANTHYTGPDKPKIDTIYYDYETSTSSTYLALRKGSVDIASLPVTMYSSMKQIEGYHVTSEMGLVFYDLPLNFRANAKGVGGLFNSLYVRQALQYGVNQKQIIKDLYHGTALTTYGPVPCVPKNAFCDPSLKNPYPFNIQKGKALLEQHGWRIENGVLTKNGQELAFPLTYASGNDVNQNIAELLAANWAQEGVKVTLDPISPASIGGIVGSPSESSKWAMTMSGWGYGPDYYPSGDGLFNTNAGYNIGGYSNSRMDQLIQETTQGGTAAEITSRFNAYSTFAAKDLPVLWIPTPEGLWVVSNRVSGFEQNWNVINQYTPDNMMGIK